MAYRTWFETSNSFFNSTCWHSRHLLFCCCLPRMPTTIVALCGLFLFSLVASIAADPNAGGALYPPGLLPLINTANALLSAGQFSDAVKAYSEAIGALHSSDASYSRIDAQTRPIANRCLFVLQAGHSPILSQSLRQRPHRLRSGSQPHIRQFRQSTSHEGEGSRQGRPLGRRP